jgi:hypothetical protein
MTVFIAEDSDSDATETDTDCRLRNELACSSVSQYFKKRQLLMIRSKNDGEKLTIHMIINSRNIMLIIHLKSASMMSILKVKFFFLT